MVRLGLISAWWVLFLATSAAAEDGAPLRPDEVRTYGSVRAIVHEGAMAASASLDSLLPDPDLYGLGAQAALAGEITIIGGRVYLAFPVGETARTELRTETDTGAALLVVSEVPSWQSFTLEAPIAFEDLDDALVARIQAAGLNPEDRIPFLVEGSFENLRWHVIDGTRLPAGGASHEEHLRTAVKLGREQAVGTLIGFYSAHDRGVFTHMDSRTHIHCALSDPVASGHVEHVDIPAGTRLRLPLPSTAPRELATPSSHGS